MGESYPRKPVQFVAGKTVNFVAVGTGRIAEARENGHPSGEKVAQYPKKREEFEPSEKPSNLSPLELV